jgi:hypothetical protein
VLQAGIPQPPQFAAGVLMVSAQTPEQQDRVPVHLMSQDPQWPGSESVMEHEPPQQVSPVWHAGLSQPPHCVGSVCRFTQTFVQHVPPSPQASPDPHAGAHRLRLQASPVGHSELSLHPGKQMPSSQ